MSKIETNIIAPSTGTTLTIGESGDTVTLGSGATQTGFGGTNTPAFSVKSSGAKALANTTLTKLSFGTEVFDTDSAFASDKFTVPSGKAGKYFLYASWQTATSDNFNEQGIYFYKNGTAVDPSIRSYHDHYGSIQISKILDLSATDYIEVYAYHNRGSSLDTLSTEIFQGYKIIE